MNKASASTSALVTGESSASAARPADVVGAFIGASRWTRCRRPRRLGKALQATWTRRSSSPPLRRRDQDPRYPDARWTRGHASTSATASCPTPTFGRADLLVEYVHTQTAR
ncbi:hypothetical protein LV779_14865 [Streptomyces thinghirensis]|nr:hypothetical protein [Streptomyces thinghirensis]